jgi:hypothetical protein
MRKMKIWFYDLSMLYMPGQVGLPCSVIENYIGFSMLSNGW